LNRKILVVDDDPTMVKLINVNLKLNSYSVVEATSGEEALRRVESEPLDLVVLNIGWLGGSQAYQKQPAYRGDARHPGDRKDAGQ